MDDLQDEGLSQDISTTHFGFQEVSFKEKTNRVRAVFDSVASKYDLMNDLMSFGIHRLWKDELIRDLSPAPGMHLLDMAGGTGDIALRFWKKTQGMNPPAYVTIADINQEMLNQGRAKAVNKGILERIHYTLANAADLNLADASFDAYTIAFGLRNVTEMDKALQEAFRVLKPGARFLCLEFSHIGISYLNKLYRKYSFHVIPRLGKIIAKDSASYQYLVESIQQFPTQERFAKMLQDTGFKFVNYRNLSNGIVAIHSALKL